MKKIQNSYEYFIVTVIDPLCVQGENYQGSQRELGSLQ